MTAPVRRRSPLWVRAMDSDTLHGIAGRFARQIREEDITRGQWRLWSAVLSELEYRRRSAPSVWDACSCWFCLPPDYDSDLGYPEDVGELTAVEDGPEPF